MAFSVKLVSYQKDVFKSWSFEYFTINLGSCKTTDGGYPGSKCVLPFIYKGKQYAGCTLKDSDNGQAWCSIGVDKDGNHIEKQGLWGHCNSKCPVDSSKNVFYDLLNITLEFSKPFKNNIGSCKTTGGGIYAGTKCALPFIYKGIKYTGCTSVDSDDGKTWCSIKVDKEGKHVNKKGLWGHCNSMCPNDLGRNTLVYK